MQQSNGLRRHHVEPDHPGETLSRAGLDLECLRTRRPKRRTCAGSTPSRRAERRPERTHDLGLAIYGATDTTALALDAATGTTALVESAREPVEQFVGIAPIVDRGRVYVSTQGFPPGGRGVIYALSAATGRIVWRFQTVKEPWHDPARAAAAALVPGQRRRAGNVYAGIANPGPWGGSPAFPNGGWFPGPALYTDALVVLAGATGKLLWYDQVTPHDVRDYDFQVSPILATVAAPAVSSSAPARGTGRGLGPGHAHPALVAGRRHPPSRSRAAPRSADARLPRAARRRRDADGVCRGGSSSRWWSSARRRARSPRRTRSRDRRQRGKGAVYASRRQPARPSGRGSSVRPLSAVRRSRATP